LDARPPAAPLLREQRRRGQEEEPQGEERNVFGHRRPGGAQSCGLENHPGEYSRAALPGLALGIRCGRPVSLQTLLDRLVPTRPPCRPSLRKSSSGPPEFETAMSISPSLS